MKIVFFGTPNPAVPSLEALLRSGHRVPAVVTRPDRPAGRSGRPRPSPVKAAATERGLTVEQPRRLRGGAFADRVRAWEPDLLVVVAYGRILPPDVLASARLGAVNVHFSLLPKYRGAAPVQWALAEGETRTGVTTMRMSEGLDEGDLLLQQAVTIEPGEHAPSLESRLAVVGAELLVRTVAGLTSSSIEARPQDPRAATFARRIEPADGEVSPEWEARRIEGRIRGFDPWPGVWVRHRGRRLRLVEGLAVEGARTGEPAGTVVEWVRGRFAVACGGGSLLELLRVQPEGRRAMPVRDAVNGRQLRAGERLERLGEEAGPAAVVPPAGSR